MRRRHSATLAAEAERLAQPARLEPRPDAKRSRDPGPSRTSWPDRLLQQGRRPAEDEGHHPDLHLEGYRNLSIAIWTHAAGGPTENDFILAAKIDQIPVKLKLIGFYMPAAAQSSPETAPVACRPGSELAPTLSCRRTVRSVVGKLGVRQDRLQAVKCASSRVVAPFSVSPSVPGFSFKPASEVSRTDRPGFDPFKSRCTQAHDSR